MSANNWRFCPSCVARLAARHEEELESVKDAYGKVSAEEYAAMQVPKEAPMPSEELMREDWEIGIYDNEFHVGYRAECQECGFVFSFEHDAQVWPPQK